MAGFTELYIDIGSDFNTIISVIDDTTRSYLNLAAYNVSSQIRKSYYSRNPTANFICSVVDAANGNVNLQLAGNTSANIKPGSYVFDVLAKTAGVYTRVLEGIIIFNPSVTPLS